MSKIVNCINSKLFAFRFFIFAILAIKINSCNCKSKNDDNGRCVSWKGLQIEASRSSITGDETFTVKINAEEFRSSTTDINLLKFKLKAYLIADNGGDIGDSKLTYIDINGKTNSTNPINEYITFENLSPLNPSVLKNITFSIIPPSNPIPLIVILELFDEEGENTVCQKEEVLWKPAALAGIKLSFDGLTQLEAQQLTIKDEEEWNFNIRNTGQDLNLKEITIVAETEHGTIFSLNGHQANKPVSLKDLLLSSHQQVDKQQQTIPIKLKLTNRNSQIEDHIVLTLMRNGEKLASTKSINWRHTTNIMPLFTYNTKNRIKGREELRILSTKERQTSGWHNIKLTIKSTNNVIFRVNGKPFQSGDLNDYLTGPSHDQNQSLNLCLYGDPDNRKESTIILLLTQEKDGKVTELDKKIIEWDNKEINLSFITSEEKQIIGNKDLLISIRNIGDPVSTKDIIINTEVTVNLLNSMAFNKTSKPDFCLNDKLINSSLTLQEVLEEHAPRELKRNEIVNPIKLHIANVNSCKKAEVIVTLKSNNQEWKSRHYEWIYKDIQFSFQNLPDKELQYEEDLHFRIKNEGEPVHASDVDLTISNKDVLQNIPLHFNSRYQVNSNVNLSICKLSELLSEDIILQTGELVDIDVARITASNSKPYSKHTIEIGLSTEINHNLVEPKEIIWKGAKLDLQVKIATHKGKKTIIKDKEILYGNNQHFSLLIFNKGSHYVFKETPGLYLQITQIQNSAIIKELHKEAYWDDKDSYLIPLNDNTVGNSSTGLLTKSYHPFQLSNRQQLHIYPTEQQTVEYKIQLCQGDIDNLTPIDTPVTIIWKPKNINVELQLLGDQVLKHKEKEVQFALINQGDVLKQADYDILQVKIERLGDKKANLTASESSFQKIILIDKKDTYTSGNLLNKSSKEIDKLPKLLPKIRIKPAKTEDHVTFKFTLLYTRKNGGKTDPIIMGRPIEVTWNRN
jgi:hypothetical protein